MSPTDLALSVTEITERIKTLLTEDEILQQVWVVGEVTALNPYRNNTYLTLGDPDSNATISCVIWGNSSQKLVHFPEVGEQVLVLGSVRIYAARSNYQLNLYQVFPAGEGLQALRYQQLKSRLEKEGLFDRDRKQPLPPYPQTLAVITSANAAAWGDIQRTLGQRSPQISVLLSPAVVQGKLAPQSVVNALERVQNDNRAEIIILARGGGSKEDLECFDDERIVRAIAACPIPIITGIGHQRDESLADLAADAIAHTPTAAAEMAVPDYQQLYRQHQLRSIDLIEAIRFRVQVESNRLEMLKHRLQAFPRNSRRLQQATAHCNLLQEKLVALDPKNVLSRGYAIARTPNGQLLRRSQDVMPGEEIIIELENGRLWVKIMDVD